MLTNITVILLGLSGAGKTFLGNVLGSIGFHLIDTSAQLERRALEWQDEDGVALRHWLDRGRANNVMAPNEAVDRAIAVAIDEVPPDQPIVISGYPRTTEQAITLATLLERSGRQSRATAITVQVSSEEALRRALNGDPSRATRADSTPEKVADRHRMFTATNGAICETLRRYGVNTDSVDGNPRKTQVAIELLRMVDSLAQTNTH